MLLSLGSSLPRRQVAIQPPQSHRLSPRPPRTTRKIPGSPSLSDSGRTIPPVPGYLLMATTWLKAVDGIEGLDERERRRLTFFLRLYLDAISPTNFAFTNPQVIHETIATGGQNLVKGMQHLLRDIMEGGIKITDTS